ncbi:MAG: M23 family metallopeptidase, partial [Candidatus Kryptoniota bacterium]
AHLEKGLVIKGEKIARGQVIGLVGSTGLSTGAHLHYGVMKNGIYVDPEFYFFSGREYNMDGLYDTVAIK